MSHQDASDAAGGGSPFPDPPLPGDRKEGFKRLAVSLLINALCPLLIYHGLKRYTRVSELTALVATGGPSLADGIFGVLRSRRLDFMAGFTLFTIALSVGLMALGGSPRLYLVRESLLTAAYGLAMLVSLGLPKPLGFYTGRYFMTGDSPERGAWFDVSWSHAWFREIIRAQTVIWGLGTLVEAAVRIYLAFTLPVSRFLIVSPLVFYGYMGLTFLAGGLYTRQWKKRRHGQAAPPGIGGSAVPIPPP